MNNFFWGNGSLNCLSTVVPEMRETADACLKRTKIDIVATCGRRGKEKQNKAYDSNNSEVQWPDGDHNTEDPEGMVKALDFHWIMPWPSQVSKEDFPKTLAKWYMWGQFVQDVAYDLGYIVGWGGDWNRDWDIQDQNCDDLVHFWYIGKRDGYIRNGILMEEVNILKLKLEESENKNSEIIQKIRQYRDLQMDLFDF